MCKINLCVRLHYSRTYHFLKCTRVEELGAQLKNQKWEVRAQNYVFSLHSSELQSGKRTKMSQCSSFLSKLAS